MMSRVNGKYVPTLLVCFVGFLLLDCPVLAQEALWKSVRTKMLSNTGYSLEYHYTGPEGLYMFDYIVQGDGDKIFTEVLDGSERGAGSRVLYDPAVDKDNVLMKTHMMTLRRSLEAKDIKDSLLYQPLFRHLIDQLVEAEPRDFFPVPGGHTILVFGEKTGVEERLEVDADGNPVAMRRLEKSRETESMKFIGLKWGERTIPWD